MGDLRAHLGCITQNFSPVAATGITPVTPYPLEQHSRTATERFVRESARVCDQRPPPQTTPTTAIIAALSTGLKHSTTGIDVLARDRQAQAVEAAESSGVGRAEGNMRQVEVLRMERVGTSLLGDLGPILQPLTKPTTLQPEMTTTPGGSYPLLCPWQS